MSSFKYYIFSLVVLFFLHSCKKKSVYYEEKILTQLKNKLNELEISETTNKQKINNVAIKKDNELNNIEVEFSKKNILIKTLGIVDEEDLNYASEIINDFFGFECIISDKLMIPEKLYCEYNVIDANKAIVEFNDYTKTLYLTENKLKKESMDLRGYTTLYGNTIIVRSRKEYMKETIIHEIGHTFGLEHCNDLTCVMAINNDEYDSGHYCEKCSDKLKMNQDNCEHSFEMATVKKLRQ